MVARAGLQARHPHRLRAPQSMSIAITTRDDFLLELGEALGGQASVNPVESAAQALEQVSSARRPQILMVDSRDLDDVSERMSTRSGSGPACRRRWSSRPRRTSSR